jgi:prepilin-type N-terminal cleavage/methylation domain-containing protein
MKKLKNNNLKGKESGFTILEVLIAVIIIGILVTVAISRYTQRSEDARLNTARSEMQMFAKAEQAIELDTGFYVSLRVLNDAHGTAGLIPPQVPQEYSIENEFGYAIETSGQYSTYRFNSDLAGDWRGPYMEFKQKGPKANLFGVDTNDALLSAGDYNTRYGVPLDPWGNAYRLYGPYYNNAFNPGSINPDPPIAAGRGFDRFAIVSFGKNTTREFDLGPVGNTGDDIIVYF